MVRKIRETHVTNFTILNINRIMDLALQILLGLVSSICLLDARTFCWRKQYPF